MTEYKAYIRELTTVGASYWFGQIRAFEDGMGWVVLDISLYPTEESLLKYMKKAMDNYKAHASEWIEVEL